MKVQREKILHFSYDSKMPDVGTWKKSFIVKRKTPALDLQHVNTKSMLTRGMVPIDNVDAQRVDTLATLMVYIKELDEKGNPVKKEASGNQVDSTDWIEDVMDPMILVKIHKEWLDYQESFYSPGEKKDASSGSTAV